MLGFLGKVCQGPTLRNRSSYSQLGGGQLPGQRTLESEDVLKWLLDETSKVDARWVFEGLAQEKPALLRESLLEVEDERAAENGNGGVQLSSEAHSDDGGLNAPSNGNLVEIDTGPTQLPFTEASCNFDASAMDAVTKSLSTDPAGDLPVVQFASRMWFCTEGEDELQLDVQRLGNIRGTTQVSYTTQDGTAFDGTNYHATSGKLTFLPGESTKTIQVKLINRPQWDPIVEFHVDLQENGLEGAVRGRYLWQARVKIMNNDTFPSSRFRQEIQENRLEDIPPFGLLSEFFRLCWHIPVLRTGTIKSALVDQVHNLRFGLKLFVSVYLIDFVFHGDPEGTDTKASGGHKHVTPERFGALVACALAVATPVMISHFLDYSKLSFKVGGTIRLTLQSSLISMFLYYDYNARSNIDAGKLLMATMRDVDRVLGQGYMNLLTLAKCLGHLMVLLMFKVLASSIHRTPASPTVYIMLFVFPCTLLIFLMFRKRVIYNVLDKQQAQEDRLVNRMSRILQEYSVINAFHQRPQAIDSFEHALKESNSASNDFSKVMLNNSYFVHWVEHFVSAMYIIFRGMSVVSGQCSLGIYLMDISIISSIGHSAETMYNVFVDWEVVTPSLEGIVRLMNLPIDLHSRMHMDAIRRAESREKSIADTNNMSLDTMHISINGPYFTYLSGRHFHFNGSVILEQQSLVVFIGPHSSGKVTLLQLLAGALLPEVDDGKIGFFMPAHLRALYVQNHCIFVHGTLMQNLTFGVDSKDPDAHIDRVDRICERLGLDADVRRHLENGADDLNWGSMFSRAQLVLLNLARGLVFNPEVLCCDRPLLGLDDTSSRRVMELFREFTQKKGLQQAESSYGQRRPRTLLMAGCTRTSMSFADKLIYVSEDGIEELTQHEAKARTL